MRFDQCGVFAESRSCLDRSSKKGIGRSWIRTSVGLRQRVYSPSPLATRTSAHKPVMGFEPATYGLQNRCSAVELHRHGNDAKTHSTAVAEGVSNKRERLRASCSRTSI